MALDILTAAEVAKLLRVSRDTVYSVAARSELPGRRVGCIWRFPKNTIESFIREHRAVVTDDHGVTPNCGAGRGLEEMGRANEVRT